MIASLVVKALNHLLSAESWAQDRLRPFAGRTAQVVGGPLALSLVIEQDGLFRLGQGKAAPDVGIRLPEDFPARFLKEGQAAFGSAHLSGSADLAETLGFVFRNLHWDAEDDLAALIGDVPARRVTRSIRQTLVSQRSRVAALTGNLSEYLAEEGDMLVLRREYEQFALETTDLTERMAALDTRFARLL